jgi:hypothetical protein
MAFSENSKCIRFLHGWKPEHQSEVYVGWSHSNANMYLDCPRRSLTLHPQPLHNYDSYDCKLFMSLFYQHNGALDWLWTDPGILSIIPFLVNVLDLE